MSKWSLSLFYALHPPSRRGCAPLVGLFRWRAKRLWSKGVFPRSRLLSLSWFFKVCQLDLTVVCLVKSSFPVGQSRSTSGSPIWRRVRPRICGFVILGPRFCGGAFGSGQPHGLHLGPARDCYSWSGVGCVCLFDFRCGGAALLGGSSSSIKTRLWLACMLGLGFYCLIVLAAAFFHQMLGRDKRVKKIYYGPHVFLFKN